MANFKKTEKVKEPESQALEVKSVEIVPQKSYKDASLSMEEYLGKHVVRKYPEKYVAMPDKETVAQKHRGWTPLKWDTDTDKLLEVPMDEATKSHSNILAWQPMALHKEIMHDWKKKQDKANQFAWQEGSKTQAAEYNSQLQSIGHGKITATPLKETSED